MRPAGWGELTDGRASKLQLFEDCHPTPLASRATLPLQGRVIEFAVRTAQLSRYAGVAANKLQTCESARIICQAPGYPDNAATLLAGTAASLRHWTLRGARTRNSANVRCGKLPGQSGRVPPRSGPRKVSD